MSNNNIIFPGAYDNDDAVLLLQTFCGTVLRNMKSFGLSREDAHDKNKWRRKVKVTVVELGLTSHQTHYRSYRG